MIDIGDDLTRVSDARRSQIVSTLGQLISHLAPLAAPVVITAPVVPPVVVVPTPALPYLYADDGEDHNFTYARNRLYDEGVNAGGYVAPLPAGAAARTAALNAATTYVRNRLPGSGGGDFGNTIRGSVAGIVQDAYEAGYTVAINSVLDALTTFVSTWNGKTSSTTIGVHADHLGESRGMGFFDYGK
ncbi:hypothetical protein [Streptacidiphilus sp. EB129]|uniref:hypothetical protein n=1 Tax=Streptacidiphilus sp. EB129 TaxID=3156262 RepID=UPI0035146F61